MARYPDQGDKGTAECNYPFEPSPESTRYSNASDSCKYGQRSTSGPCTNAHDEGDVNYYDCECISQTTARSLNRSNKVAVLSIGGVFVFLGVFALFLLWAKWQSAKNFVKACKQKKGKSTWRSGEPTCTDMFWSCQLFPCIFLFAGVIMFVIGLSRDLDSYANACGSRSDQSIST